MRPFLSKFFRRHMKPRIKGLLALVSDPSILCFDHLWAGRVSEAETCFRGIFAADQDNAGAHAGLARINRIRGNNQAALEHAKRCALLAPEDRYNLAIYGRILRDMGNLEAAAEILERVATLEQEPEALTLATLTAVVVRAAASGDFNHGVDAIIAALPTLPLDSWEPYRLSWWLLEAKGDHRAGQLCALGRFVPGVGDGVFDRYADHFASVAELSALGWVEQDSYIDLPGAGDPFPAPAVRGGSGHPVEPFLAGQFLDQRKPRVTVLKNVACLSWRFANAVMATDGRIVPELCENDAKMMLARPELPKPVLIEGTVLNLSMPWGEAFFHFMMEVVPRIAAVNKAENLGRIDKVYLRARAQYQIPLLVRLGFSEDQLIFSDAMPHIKADRLITVTGASPRFPFYEAQYWAVSQVRQMLLPVAAEGKPGPKRIYIKRGADTNGRMVVNEAELCAILETYGFTVLQPETIPFADQVRMFHEAEAFVAPAGSALMNLVFARPGTKLLVLYPPANIWRIYWSLASFMSLDQFAIIGETASSQGMRTDPDWMKIDDNVNFTVDSGVFRTILDQMLGGVP